MKLEAKEEAKDLIAIFFNALPQHEVVSEHLKYAKKCAIIHVNGIIDALIKANANITYIAHANEVKFQIEKVDNKITAEWLCSKHLELYLWQAGKLKEFCNENNITYKSCYGDGSIMFPKFTEKYNYKYRD